MEAAPLALVVQVGSRTFEYPSDCPCCGFQADDELEVPVAPGSSTVSPDSAQRLLFPYCRRCILHVRLADRARSISAALLVASLVASILLGVTEGLLIGGYTFLVGIAFAMGLGTILMSAAKRRCSPECAAVERAVTFHGWSGSKSSFSFASPSYTARFADQNLAKLVDTGERLSRLLESHASPREVPVATLPLTRDAWSIHFATQRGRLGRRKALVRALRTTYDPYERSALTALVADIELDDLLGRPDPGARQQRALRAIEQVRSDNLPDELREMLLRQLRSIALAGELTN